MSQSRPQTPDLGLDPLEVMGEITFVPRNEVEYLEMWKYEHEDQCEVNHESLSDSAGEVGAWLRSVCGHPHVASSASPECSAAY